MKFVPLSFILFIYQLVQLLMRLTLFKIFIISVCLSNHFCADERISESQIIILSDSLLFETQYELKSDSCALRITRYDSGINHGILKYNSSCNFDPRYRSKPLQDILRTIFNDAETDSVHTFAWGRLTPNLDLPSVFSQRLARTAYSLKTWDHYNGLPKKGHINDFVRDVLNESEVLADLHKVFSSLGYHLHVSGVEKVIVLSIDLIPGLKIEDENSIRLPVDCQVWFSIRSLAD